MHSEKTRHFHWIRSSGFGSGIRVMIALRSNLNDFRSVNLDCCIEAASGSLDSLLPIINLQPQFRNCSIYVWAQTESPCGQVLKTSR